jgi:hypothetical protein
MLRCGNLTKQKQKQKKSKAIANPDLKVWRALLPYLIENNPHLQFGNFFVVLANYVDISVVV